VSGTAAEMRSSAEVPSRTLRQLGFFDSLHAIGAFLHHSAHAHGHIRVLLQLHDVRRAFSVSGPEILVIGSEVADIFFFADRPLIVSKKLKRLTLNGSC